MGQEIQYVKLSNAFLGTEFFITVSEFGMVGTSVALLIIIPFSVPISVALTTCSTMLRSASGLIVIKKREREQKRTKF
jgi:hypothetical protein